MPASSFPSYETLPIGAAYEGAPADYGASHIAKLSAGEASATSDRGLTVFSPETFTEGGLLRVAKDRLAAGSVADPTPDAASKGARAAEKSQPGVQVWYEVHGKGPQRIVFIMGLNNSAFGWLGQVEKYARDPRFSVLVLDNRGYGNSETPTDMSKYSTSEMAKDVLEICQHLGWIQERQLHIVGVSMGGMISLEIAKQAPERIASLSLLSTTSGQARGQKSLITGLPPLAAVKMITRLLGGKSLGLDSDEYRVHRVAQVLFPPQWLDQVDPRDPRKRTRRETTYELFEWRFQFVRRQHPTGSLGQIRAASTHHISNSELAAIDRAVPAILIVTGDWDNLVKPGNSKHLKRHMASAKLEVLAGRGHAIQLQDPETLHRLLEENWEKGWRSRGAEEIGGADQGGEDLPSSKLGTQEHWNEVYEREVDNFDTDGDRGEIWFGRQSAQVMLDYLHAKYPAGGANWPTVLDMGTGNGHLLFRLCGVPDDEDGNDSDEGEDGDDGSAQSAITAPSKMTGIDYSPQSIDLCRKITSSNLEAHAGIDEIQWKQVDVLEAAQVQALGLATWDVILDKGTLDAIALASSTTSSATTPLATYIDHLGQLLSRKPHDASQRPPLLLITSCNFTSSELVSRITTHSKGSLKLLEVLPSKKPAFTFGGQQGETTCCVAFTSA